jgi:hypothetical protein
MVAVDRVIRVDATAIASLENMMPREFAARGTRGVETLVVQFHSARLDATAIDSDHD